ncbi:MAG: hypothetical protein JEZ09_06975 [Salinivirgaceae bacterium]|nr:hypothetical protein [Salinivirgaceae bacterium]
MIYALLKKIIICSIMIPFQNKVSTVNSLRNLRHIKKISIVFMMLVLFGACKNKHQEIDISNIQIDQKFYRFDQDLFTIPQDSIWDYVPVLEEKYGNYFDAYNNLVIRIGGTNQINYDEKLLHFLSDPYIEDSYKSAQQVFREVNFEKEISEAFKRIKYIYPNKEIPDIYTHISGFNQSLIIDSAYMSISLDKYLGVDSKFYKMLRTPLYLTQNMHPKKIPSDVITAYLLTEFPNTIENPTLLDEMVYYGKIQYVLDVLMPETNDTLKWGISEQKLDWCSNNEQKMWLYLIEHKLLFTTNVSDVKRFIDEGPFTSVFSKEAPAKTGRWIGYQIVQSYMRHNSNISLPELMESYKHQAILNNSKYKP